MNKEAAQNLVRNTLEKPFNKEHFTNLVRNVLNRFDETATLTYKGNYISDDFKDSISLIERIGQYEDQDGKLIDLMVVHLKKETSLERARTKQRNCIAKYLKSRRVKDAALVAFVAPNGDDWRFSLVKMEYKFDEQGKVKEEFMPARRHSFLVGKNESSHTAQSCLLPILLNDEDNPTLNELEQAFSVEKVTNEFFEKYRDLFLRLKESLDAIVSSNAKVKNDFNQKNIDTSDFAKKLLGQIVFLYFLQKKGWFGVKRGELWGSGSKRFLRELMEKKHGEHENFFNDVMEPLFYEALRSERSDDYYSHFKCRIPFLNGGLFDPLGDYDWVNTDILLPNELFSNKTTTKEGDIGDGILDVFDRYNFTVKEDEPLEKEVAIDPEMLGKVFENLLEIKDRKSTGTYYTPREIVHYMCQESLINYLATELVGKVRKEDIATLIQYGETSVEHDAIHIAKKSDNPNYKGRYDQSKLPQGIEKHVCFIDEKLAQTRVCDPAVGSGAFVVSMMNEIARVRNTLTLYMSGSSDRSNYDFKRHAIRDCLYGVDIDAGAVEIAKLRLWLSLVVDEDEREKIQPLPNLDYKIVQGDSLLSVEKDLLNENEFKQLEALKPLHFNETSTRKKNKYKEDIDALILDITHGHTEFDFEVHFSEVLHEKQGFDIVIGNPPYAQVKKGVYSKTQFPYSEGRDKGKQNLYKLFTEQSYNLCKDGGIACMIVQSSLMSDLSANFTRKCLLENTYLQYVLEFPKTATSKEKQVFSSVTQGTCIYLFTKILLDDYKINVSINNDNHTIKNPKFVAIKKSDLQSLYPTSDYFPKIMAGNVPILQRLKSNSLIKPLSSYTQSIQQGDINLTSYSSQFSKTNKTNIKLMRGKHVARYKIKYDMVDEYINPGFKTDQVAFNKENCFLISQEVTGTNDIRRLHFALHDNKTEQVLWGHSVNKTLLQHQERSKYFLALLNSKFMDWCFRITSSNNHVQIYELKCLPIREIPQTEQQPFTDLVDKILAAKAQDLNADTSELEAKIDQLIYQLYDLTAEEIKIVEES